MIEQPPSAEAMKLASRHADGEVKKCAAEIDALIAQRISAAVLAEQTRCVRIATVARRKYRDMDAFIADEIYQDIRGATVGAAQPREPAMTEQPPSAEAQALAEKIHTWQGYAFIDGRVAQAIDILIEERVAAETERWQNRDRQRLEQIERLQAAAQSLQSAQAERPAPSAVVDYTEQAREIIGKSCGEVVDYIHGSEPLVTWRVNERLIVNIAAALAAEREAAAIRAFGQRVWSDTEEVAYQAGATDEHAALLTQCQEQRHRAQDAEAETMALLARLQEPDVREAVKEALFTGREPSTSGPYWQKKADAVIAVIAEMLK